MQLGLAGLIVCQQGMYEKGELAQLFCINNVMTLFHSKRRRKASFPTLNSQGSKQDN